MASFWKAQRHSKGQFSYVFKKKNFQSMYLTSHDICIGIMDTHQEFGEKTQDYTAQYGKKHPKHHTFRQENK